MIKLYPSKKETLVVSHEWNVVLARLTNSINRNSSLKGWVKDDEFQLTVRLRRQQLFMPLVNGRIDPTSKGCLIFLSYSLFPGTRLLITFWTIILPLISIALAIEYNNYWIVVGFISFTAFVHLIARANFTLHVQTTRKLLHPILTESRIENRE